MQNRSTPKLPKGHHRWGAFPALAELSKARLNQAKLLSKASALGMDLSQEAQAEILIEETVKTAAIEGQILQRDSVRSSVAKKLGLPAAGLPTAGRNVDVLVDVLLDATLNYDQPLFFLVTCSASIHGNLFDGNIARVPISNDQAELQYWTAMRMVIS